MIMGRRGPYGCPVQGCTKRGTMSGLYQHVNDKHAALSMSHTRLKQAIERGETIMTHYDPLEPKPSRDYAPLVTGVVVVAVLAVIFWALTVLWPDLFSFL
jgi:hypothetical protein